MTTLDHVSPHITPIGVLGLYHLSLGELTRSIVHKTICGHRMEYAVILLIHLSH